MNKITFEDLPSTNTPVNANNLNAVQTNVETAITANGIGIVDVVTTTYGKAIKFENGFMICTVNYPTTIAIENVYGSIYRSTPITLPNYSVQFNSILGSSMAVTNGNTAGILTWNAGTNAKFDDVVLTRAGLTSSQTYNINIVTFGFWK